MLLAMTLRSVFGMLRGMNGMAPRGVGMVGCLFVVSRLMMLRSFGVVPGCVSMVFRCMFVVFDGFLRHGVLPRAAQRSRLAFLVRH
jgi:hypothetical protein